MQNHVLYFHVHVSKRRQGKLDQSMGQAGEVYRVYNNSHSIKIMLYHQHCVVQLLYALSVCMSVSICRHLPIFDSLVYMPPT